MMKLHHVHLYRHALRHGDSYPQKQRNTGSKFIPGRISRAKHTNI